MLNKVFSWVMVCVSCLVLMLVLGTGSVFGKVLFESSLKNDKDLDSWEVINGTWAVISDSDSDDYGAITETAGPMSTIVNKSYNLPSGPFKISFKTKILAEKVWAGLAFNLSRNDNSPKKVPAVHLLQ